MTIGPAAQAALDEVLAREDPTIIGVVLSGSAARTGMATERTLRNFSARGPGRP